MGSFRLFALADPVAEPVPVGSQRWRFPCPRPRRAGSSLPVAYSPLWVARGDGAPLPLRRDERGLLAVALVAPLSAVELEHRAGAAEWAGGALSVAAGLVLLGVWWRRASRA